LPEKDAEHLLAMGAEVRRRFGAPLATLAEMEREDSHLRYEAAEPFLLDHVVLQEEISRGERIRRFRIDILPTHGRRPIRVFTGTAVGHKVICRFPPVRARKVFIDVLEESEPVAWRQATLHHAGTA
jgi:alpha-L-fucosidase